MEHLKIPEGYSSPLTIRETEVAIKEVKDHFERALAKSLHLTRVSAPLFVLPQSGMNDNLNGIERPFASAMIIFFLAIINNYIYNSSMIVADNLRRRSIISSGFSFSSSHSCNISSMQETFSFTARNFSTR